MRIAICVHNLANGGAERVAALWANGFVERGDDVTVMLSEQNARVEYDLSKNVEIRNISASGNAVVRYVKKIINMRKCLKSIKADVAIAVLPPMDIWLLLATKGLKTVPIDTIHWSFERPANNPFNNSLWRSTFQIPRFFPIVTVLTNADKKIASKTIRHCYTMPNPLAFEPYYDVVKKEKIILASGRLEAWNVKGFDTLIKAWSRISYKYSDWRIQIAGRGGKMALKTLNELIWEYGVQDSVDLIGFRNNIVEDYDRASIFAFPSRYDGFGMVLIEAMSRGCACVSCDYRGRQSEIITKNDEGILCQPEDVRALANALENMIVDEKLRLKLQKGAMRRAAYFSLNKTIDRWYNIFEQESICCINKEGEHPFD